MLQCFALRGSGTKNLTGATLGGTGRDCCTNIAGNLKQWLIGIMYNGSPGLGIFQSIWRPHRRCGLEAAKAAENLIGQVDLASSFWSLNEPWILQKRTCLLTTSWWVARTVHLQFLSSQITFQTACLRQVSNTCLDYFRMQQKYAKIRNP